MAAKRLSGVEHQVIIRDAVWPCFEDGYSAEWVASVVHAEWTSFVNSKNPRMAASATAAPKPKQKSFALPDEPKAKKQGMAKPKLKNVYIYPDRITGTLDKPIPDIWTCAHADIAPKEPGQAVLCEACGRRHERGAKIIKRRD